MRCGGTDGEQAFPHGFRRAWTDVPSFLDHAATCRHGAVARLGFSAGALGLLIYLQARRIAFVGFARALTLPGFSLRLYMVDSIFLNDRQINRALWSDTPVSTLPVRLIQKAVEQDVHDVHILRF